MLEDAEKEIFCCWSLFVFSEVIEREVRRITFALDRIKT